MDVHPLAILLHCLNLQKRNAHTLCLIACEYWQNYCYEGALKGFMKALEVDSGCVMAYQGTGWGLKADLQYGYGN